MTVWNNTGQDRQFELTIASGKNGSFAKVASVDGSYVFPLRNGGVTVFAYSSASIDVYAFDGNPVTVSVKECAVGTCTAVTSPLTGSITFNVPERRRPRRAVAHISFGGHRGQPRAEEPGAQEPVPENPYPRTRYRAKPLSTTSSPTRGTSRPRARMMRGRTWPWRTSTRCIRTTTSSRSS